MRAPSKTHERAKSLRQTMTPPELALWTRLRARGPGLPAIRRQHPVGPYILDFYCAKARICIEVDGEVHSMGDQPQRDERRDAYLAEQGIRVMRYSAADVFADPDEIATCIFQAMVAPPPSRR